MERAEPTQADLSRRRVLLQAGLFVWICMCAYALFGQVAHPRILGLTLLSVLIAAPIVFQSAAKIPVYLIAAYAAIVPFDTLLVTGSGATLAKIVGAAMGGALVVSMLAMRRTQKPRRLLYVFLALTLYAGATVWWSIDAPLALSSYWNYLTYFLLFAAMALYPVTPGDMKVILTGTVVGGVLAAAYGVYIFHNGQPFDEGRAFMGSNDPYADPNDFAASLLVPTALTLIMFLRTHLGIAKLAWLVPLLVLFAGFWVSGSRGGAIAVAAVCAYLLFNARYKLQIAAAAAALGVAMLYSPIASRFAQSDVVQFGGRLDIWKVGIASLHSYWLTGAGIGNFTPAFVQYFLSTPHLPIPWDRAPHSVLVQAAVEFGIPGFLLVIAVWYLLFRELAGVQYGNPLLSDVCLALRAGILGLFIAGLALGLMESKYAWLAFSLVVLMRSMLTAHTARGYRASTDPG